MSLPMFQVDAFAERPFAGNPAAVCLLDSERDPRWMQQVAAEMNLSETAFVLHRGDIFGLRWFTPTVEVDLCGHATLASAHILREQDLAPAGERITFQTRVFGALHALPAADGTVALDFPAMRPEPAELPESVLRALGGTPGAVFHDGYDYLVEYDDEEAVRALSPDFATLAKHSARGFIATAPGDAGSGFDIVSRFFAPGTGVNEDPVTGSAHCSLAVHWGEKLDRDELRGYQASRRGGTVTMKLEEDRVRLVGHAVTVFRGEWLAAADP